MILNSLLGIEIFEDNLDSITCAIIKNKVQNYINTNNVTVDGDQVGLVRTTYLDNFNFLREANLPELQKFIEESCSKFLIHHKVDFKYEIKSWLNVYDNGMQMTPHSHDDSLISGCYYVSIPNNDCGSFYVIDHIDQREKYRMFNSMKSEGLEHKPKEGSILLFEPWMKHGVSANPSKDSRISIAFNADRT